MTRMFGRQSTASDTVVSQLASAFNKDISFGDLRLDSKLKTEEARCRRGGADHADCSVRPANLCQGRYDPVALSRRQADFVVVVLHDDKKNAIRHRPTDIKHGPAPVGGDR